MLPGITPRPRNSEKRFRGSSRVSSAAGYQISVCKLLGPSWSFRLKSSSCMVATPTGKGPGGFPVTRDTAIARPGARMWSSRKEKAVHRTVPQTRRPMRLTLSTLCSQKVMHGTERMLRSHDIMCHTYTANHCKCACFNDNLTMAHLNFILRSHQQVLEGRNKGSINRASARTQRLDGTAVKLIDMLIANFLHISLQFLGPKAMKHLLEHQQAKPQKLSMPHQVIPHLTRCAGGIFLHDMSVFCGRCLTCPSTLQV